MSRPQWIAVDFDHCAWHNEEERPADGFRDALDEFHSRGFKVIIHSCNSPAFIRKMCEQHDLRVDAIWGEGEIDHGAKPVCTVYVDDRAVHFDGDWAKAVHDVLALAEDRPIRR